MEEQRNRTYKWKYVSLPSSAKEKGSFLLWLAVATLPHRRLGVTFHNSDAKQDAMLVIHQYVSFSFSSLPSYRNA